MGRSPARPPHPATVAQPKVAPGGPAARPPHPATVAQPKVAATSPRPHPPHPATVAPRRMPGGTAVQRADDPTRFPSSVWALVNEYAKPRPEEVAMEVGVEEIDGDPAPNALGEGDWYLLKLRGWDPSSVGLGEGVFDLGKVFSRLGTDGPLNPITSTTINEFFDLRYPGFDRITSPDWRYNCGDYALGLTGSSSVGDVPQVKAYLQGDHYTLTLDLAGKSSSDVAAVFRELPPGEYVYQRGDHFVKIMIPGDGDVVDLSQKDGESAVYHKRWSRAEAAAYVSSYGNAVRLLYRKR